MRNKRKKPKTPSPFHPLPPPLPERHRGTGEWGFWSVYSTSSPPLLLSHSLPLLHVVSLPRDAVLPELRGLSTRSSSSRTVPTWVCTMGSIHQEHTTPTRVPHGRQLPPYPLLLHGHLSTSYRSGPGPALGKGSSTGCSLLQRRSTCSTVVSSMGCSVEPCSTVVLRGLQGDRLLVWFVFYVLDN